MAPPLRTQGQHEPERAEPSPSNDSSSSHSNNSNNSTPDLPSGNSYWCPLHWSPHIVCTWQGTSSQLFEHFNGDYQPHAGYEIERITMGGPVLRVWPQFAQTCDAGTNLNEEGFYRLLMRSQQHQHLIFLFSAKVAQGSTGVHVVYFGPHEPAERYFCSIKIENRAELGADPIIYTLKTFGANTWCNMLQTNEVYGKVLPNQILKAHCDPNNGNLHFWLELIIPDDEEEEEEVL